MSDCLKVFVVLYMKPSQVTTLATFADVESFITTIQTNCSKPVKGTNCIYLPPFTVLMNSGSYHDEDTFQFQPVTFLKALNIMPSPLLLVHKSHQSLNDASKEYQCRTDAIKLNDTSIHTSSDIASADTLTSLNHVPEHCINFFPNNLFHNCNIHYTNSLATVSHRIISKHSSTIFLASSWVSEPFFVCEVHSASVVELFVLNLVSFQECISKSLQ